MEQGVFQSTIPSQVSTFGSKLESAKRFISIHDTLAGIDFDKIETKELKSISIHDTLAGIDFDRAGWKPYRVTFQSTIPSQVSTVIMVINPVDYFISIHDTLAGIDSDKANITLGSLVFQSTIPSQVSTIREIEVDLGRAFQSTIPSQVSTFADIPQEDEYFISIHDTLAGIDRKWNDSGLP